MSLVLESADARNFRLSVKEIANLRDHVICVIMSSLQLSNTGGIHQIQPLFKRRFVQLVLHYCVFLDVETRACCREKACLHVCMCKGNYFLSP
jgi:hypothetical protein